MKVKVSERGQICLPIAYRKRFKIVAGDVLEIVENRGSLILYPIRKKKDEKEVTELLNRTAGMWKHIEQDGTEIVRELRRGSTRNVWGS
jgi:AbrB family looped-hinge helix DNA binding protein